MSADVINEQEESTVYTVHGVNWHLDVPLDEYNMQFDRETQIYEAASIAMYVFKGEDRGLFIVMDDGEEDPLIASTMIVNLRGRPAKECEVINTYVVFANCGYYGDSVISQKQLEQDKKDIVLEEIENERIRKQISADTNKLKKALNPKDSQGKPKTD